MKSIKKDVILIGVLVLIGLLLFFINNKKPLGTTVVVRIDGVVKNRYPLHQNLKTIIESDNGSNTLIIEDGYAYLLEATCPDKLCVNMGKIKRSGECIVCLPNKVVIEIQSSSEGTVEIDGTTY